MNAIQNVIRIIPVSLRDEQVQKLVAKLDQYQMTLYEIQHCNLDSIDTLQKSHAFMLGAYWEENLVGIGAVKLFESYGEIKRMFVEPEYRGSGIAANILSRLETYIIQQGRRQVTLETGNLQYAAIRLYQMHGYSVTEKFGAYESNPVSIYFSKTLTTT